MEHEVFEAVVTLHKDRVHAYACTLLKDTEEARDVTQEILIRLWEHRRRVEPQGARPWLMRATHNLCIDRIRRRRGRVDLDVEDGPSTPADPTPGPERLAASDQSRQHLGLALASLSPMDRAVLVLREIQELPYDEIAATLGLPLGTLKARLHRARERLRERLVQRGVSG
ncbi:MAG TPA: RNA polymerase sigma factor [Candidatus Polarisedimenticolaceae bacterium]|nr:RNA polymerase sigma factor [Candidatus Polarisedimenticolaceae bacterium]